jgi:predicted transcriptional regulator
MKNGDGRGRVRLLPYVDAELAQRLEQFCAASNATASAVVGAALRQYLDGASDAALFLRRLDRLGRAIARGQRDLELLSEAFAVFVRVWFAHTPMVPASEKKSARESAESRYRQFTNHIGEQFSGGHRFLDDLPSESIGEDRELSAVAKATAAEDDGDESTQARTP